MVKQFNIFGFLETKTDNDHERWMERRERRKEKWRVEFYGLYDDDDDDNKTSLWHDRNATLSCLSAAFGLTANIQAQATRVNCLILN